MGVHEKGHIIRQCTVLVIHTQGCECNYSLKLNPIQPINLGVNLPGIVQKLRLSGSSESIIS